MSLAKPSKDHPKATRCVENCLSRKVPHHILLRFQQMLTPRRQIISYFGSPTRASGFAGLRHNVNDSQALGMHARGAITGVPRNGIGSSAVPGQSSKLDMFGRTVEQVENRFEERGADNLTWSDLSFSCCEAFSSEIPKAVPRSPSVIIVNSLPSV
mmetsp:Transcript_70062/g.109602  ORF Transcript_70062/g.109602 Transcript_70062/m.109602 type:complete len:156 (-) Transcript_70062:856-1323(-)